VLPFAHHQHLASTTRAIEALSKAEVLLRQDHFQEALEQLGKDEPSNDLPVFSRLTWYRLSGWALATTGQAVAGEQVLKHGLKLANGLRSQVPERQQKNLAEMVEWLRCFLGMAYCSQERNEEALITQRQCKEAMEQGVVTDPELKLYIHKGLGNATLALGWYTEAIDYYGSAIKDAQNIDNTRQLGLAYWGLGVAYRKSNELMGARDAFQQALIIFERRESQQLVALLRTLFGNLLTQLGDFPEAEHQLQVSLDIASRLGDDFSLVNALGNRASLHIARHEYMQAIAIANQAMQIAQGMSDRRTEGQMHLTLASAYEAQHNHPATEQELKEAIHNFEQTQDSGLLGLAYERYAEFLASQGAFKQAFEHMRLAYVTTRRRGQEDNSAAATPPS
jgi:tetratricopeptide (TPR) repeat protein